MEQTNKAWNKFAVKCLDYDYKYINEYECVECMDDSSIYAVFGRAAASSDLFCLALHISTTELKPYDFNFTGTEQNICRSYIQLLSINQADFTL